LLDISATGEENIIDNKSQGAMNDLEYRRKQLLKLQDTVIDIEDLSSGISITDLNLSDFRVDLARFLKDKPGVTDRLPLGSFAVVESDLPTLDGLPEAIFCLKAVEEPAKGGANERYPLHPI